jgi:thymidylate synthase
MNSPLVLAAQDLVSRGTYRAPRGLKIIELVNHFMVVGNPFIYPVVKPLAEKYIRREFQWYLNGAVNPKDDRICKHASMWKNLRQPDGSFASNYGQYMFRNNGGIYWVIDTLNADNDSRQAIIPFSHEKNLYIGNKDIICTLGVIFDIRNDMLDMTVIMRSNDVIGFGAPIDWCCFSLFQEMVAVMVDKKVGTYTHMAHSFHAYEKDFKLMQEISTSDVDRVDRPPITDVYDLLEQKFQSPFGQWLMEEPL